MKEQSQQARDLFFQTELTQAEIAHIIGVNIKTIYRWIKQFEWKRIKTAARQAPGAIVERLYMQLLDLNETICSRPAGRRIPTLEEAELNRKLIVSIGKLKRHVARPESIQVLTNYTSFIAAQNIEHAHLAAKYADKYLQGAFKDGHMPYELEYEIDEPEDEIVDIPDAAPEQTASPEAKPAEETAPAAETTPATSTAPEPPAQQPNDTNGDSSTTAYDPGITPQDFEKYKALLTRPCANIRETMLFHGKVINQMAFEYNLRQMMLPPAQRQYLTEQQYLRRYYKK